MTREKEFLMTDKDFVSIREKVYDTCGIVLGDHKKEMVYSRLARRLRHYKIKDFKSYLAFLDNNMEQEFSDFINSVTTNLTSFFRENHHFEFLAQTIMPELKKWHAVDKKVRIWSAGCSTGEEPYSISMTLANAFSNPMWDFKILATDLDSNVLAKASAGEYTLDNATGLDDGICRSWFLKGKEQDNVKVKPELRKLITFKRLNLLQEWPMKGQFDVIFCRNVVIYFDQPTKDALFRRYAKQLRPGGYLILGHSESMSKTLNEFESLGKTIYRRR